MSENQSLESEPHQSAARKPDPEPVFEQDKFGIWCCRFGDEEYPHFADLIGFAHYAYILKRPGVTIRAREIECRPLPISTRSVQVVGQTGKRRRGVGENDQSLINDDAARRDRDQRQSPSVPSRRREC